MGLNAHFWQARFEEEFIPQVRALIQALEGRLLPTFSNMKDEAEAKAQEEYHRLGSLPARDDIDMADVAEEALQLGILAGLRQGLQNMFAAALFHLYEQQVMTFHRREVLHPSEENNPKFLRQNVFQDRLAKHGVDITAFSCWPILEELRLLANTVKHAEGESALKLQFKRPDLFVAPCLEKLGVSSAVASAHVYAPLMGDDIYVSVADLRLYAKAVEHFWQELGDALLKA